VWVFVSKRPGPLKQGDGGKVEVDKEAVVTFTRGEDKTFVADEYGGFYEYERGTFVWPSTGACLSGFCRWSFCSSCVVVVFGKGTKHSFCGGSL
jgi:hypothetical protein